MADDAMADEDMANMADEAMADEEATANEAMTDMADGAHIGTIECAHTLSDLKP